MSEPGGMTYKGSGVDYDAMDPFKRACQLAALRTAGNLEWAGLKEVEWSRGESVYLVYDQVRGCYWGHVHEGLGTKNLVADRMVRLETSYYSWIAQDTLAMGINDAATLGIRPTTVTMHLAVGSSSWFNDERRYLELIDGWVQTCMATNCTWAGGETPTLKDILLPNTAELSCSVYGMVEPQYLIQGDICKGDSIVLLSSSGIQANGITLARKIHELLPQGYRTVVADGKSYGELLLTPTLLYGPVVEAIQQAGIKIHYCVNITGHGWRKLMRSTKPFVYVIEHLPEPQPIFGFIQRHGKVDMEEMYGNYNMGAGFALYVHERDAPRVIQIARRFGMDAMDAGHIASSEAGRHVEILPLGIRWNEDALAVR